LERSQHTVHVFPGGNNNFCGRTEIEIITAGHVDGSMLSASPLCQRKFLKDCTVMSELFELMHHAVQVAQTAMPSIFPRVDLVDGET
jgi:hypothetical protein